MDDRNQRPPGRPLDRSSALPLWAQVRDDLLRRVDAGEFTTAGQGESENPPGGFPGEMALSEDYAVSRQTIRQAVRHLRDSGTLVGERGRPPRVAGASVIQQPLGALYSLHASVVAAGLSQHSVVRELEICTDADAAAVLHLPPGTALLHLERVRLAGDEPLAHDHAWLPAALTRPLLDADFTHTALYAELASRCGIALTGGSEQVRAVIPTQDQRDLLRLDDDTALLSIERIGCLGGVPTELRRTVVRGDRFAVNAEFSRTAGYRMAPNAALNPAHPPTSTATAAKRRRS